MFNLSGIVYRQQVETKNMRTTADVREAGMTESPKIQISE